VKTVDAGHKVVSREEWLEAHKELLAREKAFTRQRDELSRERRELPWVKVDKTYVFDSSNGKETLADLFAGKSQLIVYHFMFGPDWEEGCPGCSFLMDNTDGALAHLEQRDVTFVAISRAPLSKVEAFKRRMGWGFKWVSSYGSDFNYDYHVSFTSDEMAKGKVPYNYGSVDLHSVGETDELFGVSVFYQTAHGDIFHTYSTYARGGDALLGTYQWLDLTPKGRDETGPRGNLGDWVKHHDRYA